MNIIYANADKSRGYLLNGFSTIFFRTNNTKINTTGNIAAKSRPILRSPPAMPEKRPTIDGPTVAPISPAKAKNANIAVPPMGHFCAEILIVPGHMIPTEIPHSAQPANPIIGKGDRDAIK